MAFPAFVLPLEALWLRTGDPLSTFVRMSRPRGVAGLAGRPPPFPKRSGQLRDVTKGHYEAFQRRLRFGEERSRRLGHLRSEIVLADPQGVTR